MRKRPSHFRLMIADFRLNAVWWALLVVLVLAGPAVQAGDLRSQVADSAKSKIYNLKSAIPHKDLIASMEDAAARRSLPPELSSGSEADAKDEPVYVTLLSFIFKLAVVVALAYGTIYALKRFNVSTFKRSNVAGIRVVENTSLGANRSLHVVEIGGRRLLVASTPNQVNLLTELEIDSGSHESLVISHQPEAGSVEASAPSRTNNCQLTTKNSFRDQLSTFMGAKPDTGDAASNVAQLIRGSSTFIQEKIVQLGRLRRKMRDA
jgi:flagellar biosynthetic protein FliO